MTFLSREKNTFKNSVILATILLLFANSQNSGCLAQDAKQRSTDTHAIDEFPTFDKKEEDESTKTVERTAEKQIKESIENDTETKIEPSGSGTVMSKTKQKMDASSEATKIDRDDPNEPSADADLMKIHRPTIALALGGGGVRGTAHIGVLKVLKEAEIPIDYIVGNSMGSIVGGLYAAGAKLDDIERIMIDGSLLKAYMPGMLAAKLLISPISKVLPPWRKHYAGLWTGKKFGKFLEKQIPSGVENVEDTVIPFSAVATNLIDGKAYRISNGRLSTAMRASSSIPSILQPVAIGDRVYVDGGVRANLPASAARDTGADIVIAVLVDEPLKVVPAKRFRHLSGIFERLGDVMLAVSDARQLPFADIIINPQVSGLPVLKGDADDARKAILAGETATRKALPDIRRVLKTQMNRKMATQKSKVAN
ncbi:MAG: hypothetical protein DKT66_26985 [Candidatus Melainabacteria bacterium]|nr:MAG: hypothetical protein DKT66_26985 [Candidatus Melainabacteria bacterium]